MRSFAKLAAALAGLALFLAGSAPALAQDVRTATVRGCSVSPADSLRARDEALQQAFRSAVEEAAGTIISSETLVENMAVVEDRIYAQAAGYIRSRTILSEGPAGGVYCVEVRCEVTIAQLQSDLLAIGFAIKEAGLPRVVVVGDETVDNKPTYDRFFATQIEAYLTTKGFIVVDATAFESLKERNAGLADTVYNDFSQAMQIANRFNAELAVTYKVNAEYAGAIGYAYAPHVYASSGRVRIPEPSTARLSAAMSDTMRGSAEVQGRAAEKALEDLGSKMGPKVVEALLKAIKPTGPIKNYFELSISDINYSDARNVSKQLATLSGVDSVGKTELLAGVATIRLEGSLQVNDLADAIADTMPQIEIESVEGNAIKARFAKPR